MTMTPDYVSKCGTVKLWRADCRDVLPAIEGIDAVVSDPPYGISFVKGSSGGQGAYRGVVGDARLSRGTEAIEGDNEPFDPSHLLAFSNVLIWGANHYAARLPEGKGRWLAWNKLEYLESFDSFSDIEFAWHSVGKVSRVFNYMWKGGLACRKAGEDNGRRVHPTQKPIALMQWCIEQSGAREGAVICDPYMGSGTTGVACLRMNRRFVGIESTAHHFATAVERIEAELRQPRLFPVAECIETQGNLFGEVV